MIPAFDGDGLPPGIHWATWEDVVQRFGWNDWRRQLLAGLQRAIRDLQAVGCRQVWLDGSFVTTKEAPGDFDLCWDIEEVDVETLPLALRDVDPPRALQKAIYGGDVLPNVTERDSGKPLVEFFQEDSETGKKRGIIAIDLRSCT